MEPFENDKNQNTEPVMAENMTSAYKAIWKASPSFSQISRHRKISKFLCTTLARTRGNGDTLVLHNGDIEIRLAVASNLPWKGGEFIKKDRWRKPTILSG